MFSDQQPCKTVQSDCQPDQMALKLLERENKFFFRVLLGKKISRQSSKVIKIICRQIETYLEHRPGKTGRVEGLEERGFVQAGVVLHQHLHIQCSLHGQRMKIGRIDEGCNITKGLIRKQ